MHPIPIWMLVALAVAMCLAGYAGWTRKRYEIFPGMAFAALAVAKAVSDVGTAATWW